LPRIVHAFGERFKTCFWNENHPELFASPSTMLSGTQKSLFQFKSGATHEHAHIC
jgi:hypothetical protein